MATRKCGKCDMESSGNTGKCPYCGNLLQASLSLPISFKWILFSGITIFLLWLVFNEPDFEPENLLSEESAGVCIKGNDGYKGNNYKKYCDGKSVKLSGFVNEIDGDEYTLYTKDSISYGSYKFYVYPHSKGPVMVGDKVSVEGVFDSYSVLGYARVNSAAMKEAELTSQEFQARKQEKELQEFESKQKKKLFAYYDCADTFMATKPGAECPKSTDSNGVSGYYNDDGSIHINGLCFFGARSITFECKYRNGSALIEEFKVH